MFNMLNFFCTTCDVALHRTLINFACVCMDGYYEDINGICQLCDPSCDACISTALNCICRLGKV